MPTQMDETTMNGHYSPETLASYALQELPEDKQLDVQEHLADCDRCAGSVHLAIRASGLVDRWTAQTHGAAALQGVLVHALDVVRAQPALAAWRDRLTAWAERWAGQAEATLRIVLDAPGTAARVLTEGMQELARPGASWQFAPAPAAIPTRGAGRRRAAGQTVVVSADGDGTPSARVAVSGERREVVVRLDDLPASRLAPLVLLIPADHAGDPRLALPQRSPDDDAWIARFEGLEPGDYLIAFEPLA